MANNQKKGLSRRAQALIWMLVVAIVIGSLIAYEQIAILYVLASLALVALLLIVGWSNLEAVERVDPEATER